MSIGPGGQRDGHHDAVGFAVLQVQELENIVLAAKEVQQEVMGVIMSAVGEATDLESANNAREWTGVIESKLDEIVGLCESIKAELLRYGGGF